MRKTSASFSRCCSNVSPHAFTIRRLVRQQLSEMFNVNHFIISQANPHAVMFANYNAKAGVWSNPITGLIYSIVTFLKDQVRSWLEHLVECIGARRIAPLFETERGTGFQFFTQEYEGRASDISLIPWINHRGLLSAMLHIIYNPSEAEFREWIEAAERETWKYIPAIKSHIAEEITLDLCVQRLRRRVMFESWQKDAGHQAGEVSRVPSFFTSPSLVNLGGLNVADTHVVPLKAAAPRSPIAPPKKITSALVKPEIDIHSGWGGLGLRGNRSSGNLARSTSDASGLFIDGQEEEQVATIGMQDAGQDTGTKEDQAQAPKLPHSLPSQESFTEAKGYVKTTSMAHFYYRKSVKSNEMEDFFGDPSLTKTTSETTLSNGNGQRQRHQRKKSQSHQAFSSS